MKKIVLIICLCLIPVSGWGQGFERVSDIRAFCDEFMDQIVRADFQAAFDSTKSFWPVPEVEVDGIVNQVKQQWPLMENRFGSSLGAEWIRGKRIGASFLRYYFLHKFEKHAIQWQMDFYKPQDYWIINGITFEVDLNPLYE
ncbi:MAG: hypothetical protein MI747_11455 [Desulfobacterales bacterium]|nr:hypothetical protein [Desulfobacterales bacterium]